MNIFVVSLASSAFAMPKTLDKIKGGVEKIVKSPIEVPNHLKTEYNATEFKPFGFLGGLVKGSAYMVIKGVEGAVDIVTSPMELGK